MKRDPHRDFCRRQHRLLARCLAIQAWHRQVDCIVLERRDLETLLGLERFKGQRVKWLLEDTRPWFAYQQPYYNTRAPSSIHSLWLARIALDTLPRGAMKTEARLLLARQGGLRAERLRQREADVPGALEIATHLALLADGLAEPRDRFVVQRRSATRSGPRIRRRR